MDGHAIYVQGHAKNYYFPIDFAIYTKALWTNGPTHGPTDGPMDQLTDQQTNERTNPLIKMPENQPAMLRQVNALELDLLLTIKNVAECNSSLPPHLLSFHLLSGVCAVRGKYALLRQNRWNAQAWIATV